MRTSPATRVAVMVISVAAFTPVVAAAQCDDGQTGTLTTTCFTCSGSNPAQTPLCTLDHQSRTRTTCRDNAWKSKTDYPWQVTTKNEFSQCGGANAGGQPQCFPAELAWTYSVSGTTVTFTITTAPGVVDGPGGTGCTSGTSHNQTWTLTGPGCSADVCCDPNGCAAADGTFVSSSCTCTFPTCLPNDTQCDNDSDCCSNNCNMTCRDPSPILIDLENNAAAYHLTSVADGVSFDLNVNGTPERLGWTQPYSSIALLVLDRNQNGTIDDGSELFGNMTRKSDGTRASNGFEALLDLDGGTGISDGKIDANDSVFAKLRLWFDRNHNGLSESNELVRLGDAGIVAISTAYRETPRVDRHGNRYWLEGTAVIRRKDREHSRKVFDVVFATQSTATRR
jgi:hypothetical protein